MTRNEQKIDYYEIHKAADTAGCAARIPLPFNEGTCGGAYVWFAGNTGWGRWARKALHARRDYPSGLRIDVYNQGSQSLVRAEAYAMAYAEVLRKHGIEAYGMAWMD